MAGLDTVASTLGLIVKAFAEQPEDRRRFVALIEDERALADAVEELVRFHAIVTAPRRVTREHVFRGTTFQQRSRCGRPRSWVSARSSA